jgi:methylmalonyl-CoA mutase, N-terminal domain
MNNREFQEKFKKWEKDHSCSDKKNGQKTNFGSDIDNVYLPDFQSPDHYLADLNFPGEFPYTRGIRSNMYRDKLWTMRQYAGFGSAFETNKRFKYLIDQGQTGLSVAFDLPTQIGYDSDHYLSIGEVGKVGVAIDSVDDMRTLFNGIRLDKVSTSMTINATAAILLAMYIVLAEENKISPRDLNGTIQNDVLKEYIARGCYIFPPAQSLRITTDIFEFASREMPKFNTISISGYHIREAGSNAVQELAFTFADGIEYVKAAIKAGLDIDIFASRLSFFFNAHNDILEEVAKFRAARRIWAKIMKERFKAKDPKSMLLRFHTQTAGSTLTSVQPENNIVRVAFQALSAVLGGTQSLHTNSMDEALALPSEDAVRIALKTQQIIGYESGVTKTVDPLGGSYYIEALTDDIEKKVFEYINKIDDLDGMIKAIESGYVKKEIQDSAYRYQKEIENGLRVIVGLNKFKIEKQKRFDIHYNDENIEKNQIERLQKLKTMRKISDVETSLEELYNKAMGSDNLMPGIIKAVKVNCTIGEISDTLRKAFGEYREIH